jgi:hypothetical protein
MREPVLIGELFHSSRFSFRFPQCVSLPCGDTGLVERGTCAVTAADGVPFSLPIPKISWVASRSSALTPRCCLAERSGSFRQLSLPTACKGTIVTG